MVQAIVDKIIRREDDKGLNLEVTVLEIIIENIFDKCKTRDEIEFVFDSISRINEESAERKIDDLQNS